MIFTLYLYLMDESKATTEEISRKDAKKTKIAKKAGVIPHYEKIAKVKGGTRKFG